MTDVLFAALKAGALTLPNRIIMAPLTRCRASAGRVPNVLMEEYYGQRSGFGLIISEATSVDAMGVGYPDTPGIWSDDQVIGWKKVTERVHAKGGQMLLQLWHVGRMSDPIYLNGKKPVSSSAVRPAGHVSLLRPEKGFEEPRALSVSEIKCVVEQYKRGAENAMTAGFDGVEIHGANGYLIDQFLQDSVNKREDEYGGSVENRMRFMLEVVDVVTGVWGADRVGMHLAPRADAHDMGDSDLPGLFRTVATELGKRKLAFICARENFEDQPLGPSMKECFGGVYIGNEGFTAETAREAINEGKVDAVAFGKAAIANPDLVERFRTGASLNAPVPETFYGSGPKGYTDYPTLQLSTFKIQPSEETDSMKKILAFSGSLRAGSFNQKLVKIAAEGARVAGAEVTVISLSDFPMPLFDQDLEEREGKPEAAQRLKKLFSAHDALLIASPEYNSMITAALKNAIDWVSRADSEDEKPLSAIAGKTAAIISASPGGYGGSRSLGFLREMLGNIKVTVLEKEFSLPKAHEEFEEDGSLLDAEKALQVKAIGAALAEA